MNKIFQCIERFFTIIEQKVINRRKIRMLIHEIHAHEYILLKLCWHIYQNTDSLTIQWRSQIVPRNQIQVLFEAKNSIEILCELSNCIESFVTSSIQLFRLSVRILVLCIFKIDLIEWTINSWLNASYYMKNGPMFLQFY